MEENQQNVYLDNKEDDDNEEEGVEDMSLEARRARNIADNERILSTFPPNPYKEEEHLPAHQSFHKKLQVPCWRELRRAHDFVQLYVRFSGPYSVRDIILWS